MIDTQIDKIFAELLKYDEFLLGLEKPIDEKDILKFEIKYSVLLPSDFRKFLIRSNGFTLNGFQVHGIDFNEKEHEMDRLYDFLHYKIDEPISKHFIPFQEDGFGNYYVFDLRRMDEETGQCPVLFWQHDRWYEDGEQPEYVSDNFIDYVWDEIIKYVLEEYNYDGSEK